VGWGKSTLPGAGYGLFALRDIQPGEYICTYEGYQIHIHKCLNGDYSSEYLLDKGDGMAIDAADFCSCMGRFINDPMDNQLYNCLFEVTLTPILVQAQAKVKLGYELFTSYGKSYKWVNPTLQERANKVLYITHHASDIDESFILPTNAEISIVNNLFKPSRQDTDGQQEGDQDLYADTRVPSQNHKKQADKSLCTVPVYRGGGKGHKSKNKRMSPNVFLHNHYYLIDGEPAKGDCAFDAIRMNIMAVIVRYPKAFDEVFYTRELDLSITSMRHRLSTLIRSQSLYRDSKARELGITEATYKGYITTLFATDPYGNKCETTRKENEDESSWIWRACECLIITEQTATDRRPCVWITVEILVLLTRFYLLLARFDDIHLPNLINIHDETRFQQVSFKATIFRSVKQAGFSSLIVTKEELEDPDIETMCLGHDCLVVFTTCTTGKGNKKFKDAGHFNTYIRCFPIDHSKTTGHISQEQWLIYASYVRENCYIPKLRFYETYTTLQAAAALASLENVCILREDNNDTLLTDTTEELIEQLLQGITKSTDCGLIRTLEATINFLQQVVLSGAKLSVTALENVQRLIREDPSCRVRLTIRPTNTDETIRTDSNINLDVSNTLIKVGEMATNNIRLTAQQVINANAKSDNEKIDDMGQHANTANPRMTWPHFDPNTVRLKRSLPTSEAEDTIQSLKAIRIGEPLTSEIELLTNRAISDEMEIIPKQNIISPISGIVDTHIVSINNNATESVQNTNCATSAAKIYFGFTDEQWKLFSSNQKKKHRKNMQRDIQKSDNNN
jgi:hypothetical protein